MGGGASSPNRRRNFYVEPNVSALHHYKDADSDHLKAQSASRLELAIAHGNEVAVKAELGKLAKAMAAGVVDAAGAGTADAATDAPLSPVPDKSSSDSFKSPVKGSLAEKKHHFSAHKVREPAIRRARHHAARHHSMTSSSAASGRGNII